MNSRTQKFSTHSTLRTTNTLVVRHGTWPRLPALHTVLKQRLTEVGVGSAIAAADWGQGQIPGDLAVNLAGVAGERRKVAAVATEPRNAVTVRTHHLRLCLGNMLLVHGHQGRVELHFYKINENQSCCEA